MRTKNRYILLVLVMFCQFVNAQFDEKFYFPKKEWKEVHIPHSEEFIAVENDTIHTTFFQTNKKIKATILFFHGAGGNISTYMYMIKPLVENGYQVYAVDFRGYGKSTGKPTHVNVKQDAEMFFQRVQNTAAVKNTKLIVYGASLGCQIATYIANKHQKEINGLILDGGFASFADVAKLYAPKEAHTYIDMALGKMYPSKEEIKEIINVPKLIIHGKADKSIPIEQSKIVYSNAQEPKVFFESEEDHLNAIKLETKVVFKEIDKLLTIQ
ncbi:alpha/beta hydrolase [Tenacibaculum sp. 190130A14a]|uniref:Hydrolase_4 domain-containing protein n=1 Tax=Tenacibaculum polynesiense TaxID=3137857 RepID=A0ABM9P745_9FLAO